LDRPHSAAAPPLRLTDAEALLARRLADWRDRAVLAEDRWRRYREAAARHVGVTERSGLEQRLDRLLARGRWPGRTLQLARSGLWLPRLAEGLGWGGGPTVSLPRYVRAGPDPQIRPKALFDQVWYLEKNPELMGGQWPPLAHYLVLGDPQGRSPHPLFDARDYRARHAVKVAASRQSALQHFLFTGAQEGFDPHPLFDLRWYVGRCEELAETGENPLIHYLRQGWREGLDPHPLFAGDWYLEHNPQAAEAGSAPLLHYVMFGAAEGRDPHPLFDAAWYSARRRDVAGSGYDPLSHFVRVGARQRSSPGPHFDVAYYLEQQVELAETAANPLVHYVTEGAFTGAWPAADFDEGGYLAEHPEVAGTPWSGLEHSLRTHAAPPTPAPGAQGRWVSAEALFEQLRVTARARDPAAYNLPAWLGLAAELRRQAAEDRAGSSPPAPAMGPLAEADRGTFQLVQTCSPAAADAAARAGAGPIVLFADRPVQVAPDALAALQAALDEPGVAAAAPKLLGADGRIWSAGAGLTLDGTVLRQGAGEAGDAGDWAAPRELDAAGEVAAVRRADLLAAGGLDAAFATLPAALADLTLRLRARGLRTAYAPAAAARIEPPDATGCGAVRDAQRLLERWAEAIEALHEVRLIAFHRPDLAGPAAWNGVARALPNYRGHYQPHLPGELGFYDDDAAALRRQADLARRYGLAGFCHPFRVEAPPAVLLAADGPDFGFCLCVGEDAQGEAAVPALVAALAPYLAHPRALRVQGAALLAAAAAPQGPDGAAWTSALRKAARAKGLGELFLVRCADFAMPAGPAPLEQGFDAAVDFAEAGEIAPIPPPGPVVNRRHQGVVRDYRALARQALAAPGPERLPAVAPGFDDAPCGQDLASVFHHASPGAFQAWLEGAMAQARRRRFGQARLVFVHAWNGWLQGAHLEPDVRFGHGWLEAARNAADADLLERA